MRRALTDLLRSPHGRFVGLALLSIAVAPWLLGIFNHYVTARFYVLPPGLRAADEPLYSYMALTPGYRGESVELSLYRGAVRKPISLDENGFRNPPIDYRRPLVMLSGDSTIFGMGYADDETVSAHLQAILGDRASVINASVPGKAIPHNLLTMRHLISLARANDAPAAIFVNWVNGGDVEYVGNSLATIERIWIRRDLSRGQRLAIEYPVLHEAYRLWLRAETAPGGPILELVEKFFAYPPTMPVPARVGTPPGAPQPTAENILHLRAMGSLAKDCAVHLVHAANATSDGDFAYPEMAYATRLADVLRATAPPGVAIIDMAVELAPVVRAHPDFPAAAFAGHPEPIAAPAIAAALARQIEPLLDRAAGRPGADSCPVR